MILNYKTHKPKETRMSPKTAERSKYPYLPFSTFRTLLEKMEKEGVPGRIDRTYLGYTSGIMQTYLIATLRSFGLIDENNSPTDELVKLAKAGDERPAALRPLIETHYSRQLALGRNATAGQLDEAFKPLQGETKRKAITFFLHAAKYAGIELSRHFKAPRAPRTTGGKTTRKAVAPQRQHPQLSDEDGRGPMDTGGDSDTIELDSGGAVTLTVSVSLLSLSPSDREFVLRLVDQFRAYGPERRELPAPIDGGDR
jgi:hypothetical protein